MVQKNYKKKTKAVKEAIQKMRTYLKSIGKSEEEAEYIIKRIIKTKQ